MSLLSRRQAVRLGIGAAALGAGLLRPAVARAYQGGTPMGLPDDLIQGEPATVTALRTSHPIVAMTYDDGPHPTLTPRLLDALKARGLRATFYLIGKSVVTWPDIVRRIADEGHEIGNHTWSHPNLARLSDTAVLREIDRTSEAIQEITGRPPVTFRPPYGAFTARQRQLLFARRDMPTVLWSVDPLDWRRPGSEVVKQRILAASSPGAIILSHDIHKATVRAMPGTFDGLTARGLRFRPMSQMLGWPIWQQQRFHRVADGRMAPNRALNLIALQ